MDKRLALMCGTDIPVPECQLTIHQPRIKEISLLGEQDFFIGVQSFCIDKNLLPEDKGLLSNTNNFQIFMTIMSEKETADKKIAVQQVLTLFFPECKANFTPRSLIFSKQGSMITVDENNFEFLQNAISDICCLKTGGGDQKSFNPANAKASEIARKLMRGRQRVAEQKGELNTSIFSQYLSVLVIGTQLGFNELQTYTMYQIFDLMERYSLYTNWDIDLRCRLAGGKPDTQPDNWMKNIH